MTDKQIIIKGVDVSECPYYRDSEGGCSSHDCECIKFIHNECFYKDYKRKEQECKRLKQTLAEIKKIAEILAPMTDEYENCYDRDRCFECDFTEDCSYFNTKRIIQICDGAINE